MLAMVMKAMMMSEPTMYPCAHASRMSPSGLSGFLEGMCETCDCHPTGCFADKPYIVVQLKTTSDDLGALIVQQQVHGSRR